MNREETKKRYKEISDYYLEHYNEGLTLRDMAEIFDILPQTIHRALIVNGVNVNKNKKHKRAKMFPDRDSEIINDYLHTDKTLDAIGKDYNISKQRVLQIINSYGVEKRTQRNDTTDYGRSEVIFEGLRLWMNKNNVTKVSLANKVQDSCYNASNLSAILRGSCYIKKPLIDDILNLTKLPYDFCFNVVEEKRDLNAQWKINSDGYYPYCSNCNYEPTIEVQDFSLDLEELDFCPKCGAKMLNNSK